MDASLVSDGSVLGTAMAFMASGTNLRKRCLTLWNGVTLMLKSRPGLLIAGVVAGFASLCTITAGASAADLPAPGSAAASAPVTEDYARAQITRDGYTKLSDLQKTDKGWTAKALEDGKQVSLVVSSLGGVQKQ